MNILNNHFTIEKVNQINLDKKSLSDYLKNVCEELESSTKSFDKALEIPGPVKRKENRKFFFDRIDSLEKEKNKIYYFINN